MRRIPTILNKLTTFFQSEARLGLECRYRLMIDLVCPSPTNERDYPRCSERFTSTASTAKGAKAPTVNAVMKEDPERPTTKGKARLRNPGAEVKGSPASQRVQNAPVNESRVTRRQTQTEVEWEVEEIVEGLRKSQRRTSVSAIGGTPSSLRSLMILFSAAVPNCYLEENVDSQADIMTG
ncbi:uncharacterized protein FTOL_08593 [Fusarium torulosum]|uniref:Uncharacterized protein n=1 Tax=Fusarium torulosum TaxID=33205 RepID=A0AAE8MD23_9HYPO|nr:uncharacterized protein FTOL_08593 [Fusarium torulosum]